jgi:hypothetical protein
MDWTLSVGDESDRGRKLGGWILEREPSQALAY